MPRSNHRNGGKVSWCGKSAVIAVIAALAFFGCTRSIQKPDSPSKHDNKPAQAPNSPSKPAGKPAQTPDSVSKPNSKSIQKSDSISKPDGKKDGIVLGKPVINPSVVSAGETVRQELKYSISGPKTGNLNILEVIVISGEGLKIELSRRKLERTQESQVSTLQFKTPKGLPAGEYQLITTFTYGKETGKTTGRLRVKQ